MTTYRTSPLIVAAAIFLLLVGFLFFLIGALFGVVGGLVVGGLGDAAADATAGSIAGAVGGTAVVVGLIVVAWGIVQVVAGSGMLAHRAWGRVLGLVAGIVGLGFYGLALLNGLAAGAVDVLNVAVVAGYALTVVALGTGAVHFREV